MTGSRMFEVRRAQVDLGAEGAGAVGKLAGLHAAKQVEVLLDGAIAIRAIPWPVFGSRPPRYCGHLLAGEVADIRLAGLDELHRPLIKLLEVFGGVVQPRPTGSRASGRPPGWSPCTRPLP